MEDRYILVYWEYGNHCDEFLMQKAAGPYNIDEAMKLESEYNGEYHIDIVKYFEVN